MSTGASGLGEAGGGPTIASAGGLDPALMSRIVLGKAFAYVPKSAFSDPGFAWLLPLLAPGGGPKGVTIPLLGAAEVNIPGAKVRPMALPSLRLGVVTSDKALYREGRDVVNLLALDPLAPGSDAVLEVHLNGVDHARLPVRLNGCGAASKALRELPVGAYEVRFRGAPKDEPACCFTVAEYRLAPLVASLMERKMTGSPPRLAFTLSLSTFGAPVSGGVVLELLDRGARAGRVTAEARGGIVQASFALEGEGPHAISVQLAADPGRTASVPIVGSRAAERSLTTFSALGDEVMGSLLPGEASQGVRGIFLERGARRTTPFALERVDTKRARITALAGAEAVRVVAIDPTVPAPRAGAPDVASLPYPGSVDTSYLRGERLFQDGDYEAARKVFEDARQRVAPPHPSYMYFVACCHARLGDRDRAVAALRAAIEDGWIDLAHMAADDDLAILRGHGPFEALTAGGRAEVARDAIAAGESIEIDVPNPLGLILIGALLDGERPWEGFAVAVTPESVAPRVVAPERAAPGSDVTIEVEAGAGDREASVYLVLKDARLLSADTPQSRLAGQSKRYVDEVSASLAVGQPEERLDAAVMRDVGSYELAAGVEDDFIPYPMAYDESEEEEELEEGEEGEVFTMARAAPSSAPSAPSAPPSIRERSAPALSAGPGAARSSAPTSAPVPSSGSMRAPVPSSGSMRAPASSSASRRAPMPAKEPEVVFAGLLPVRDGRASVSVRLGEAFTDYIAEAFVIAGLDWAPAEARFRASKDLFASFDIPAFVHPEDTAIGRVHAGAGSGRMRARVTRGGEAVELFLKEKKLALGEIIAAARAELTFVCGPGDYEVVVEDASTGASDRAAARVDEPGKLKRIARAVRFLSPGEGVALTDDPSILSLRVLPALDKPFSALVEATADYGHACCEQTAAKMLAAAAMYALSAGSPARRDKAESILLAGVRREAQMWLRGRGFKMYPESPPQPDEYWGSKAARHLRSITLLEGIGGREGMSPALAKGIDDISTMATDAMKAYRIEWPSAAPANAEDAFIAVRFGDPQGQERVLVSLRKLAQRLFDVVAAPRSDAVGRRAALAYTAAALLRGGVASDRATALACANAVVSDLGPEGRLYSTVDSAAAIALLAELSAAGILAGGEIEVDGRRVAVGSLAGSPDAESSRALRAASGVVAVEVTRVIEERWDALRAEVPARFSLSLAGAPAKTRVFRAGDAIDLTIELEEGYKPGDLVWVCLPDALSRVFGGGQIKRFSIDLEGRRAVTIPLAATAVTVDRAGAPAPQRFAACVRNMFEEERASSPGLLDVTVLPLGG
jgi:hypothetical protein